MSRHREARLRACNDRFQVGVLEECRHGRLKVRSTSLAAFIVFAVAIAGQAQQSSEKDAFSDIEAITQELSQMTGMKVHQKVKYDTIDKTRLRTFLEERIKEEVKPEEIRVEEITLKKFGLVPQDFDLKKTTIELMTEQAAAFYDYRKKTLFLLDAKANPEQRTVLTHELAHALADQNFNLAKYIKHGQTDDNAVARVAVMEGQASWLMYESMAQKMGQSLRTSPQMVALLTRGSDAMIAQYPVLSNAPLYMRASLLFPYTAGLKFQNAILEKLGKDGFSEVFRNPPETTQHILHPEMYLNRTPVAKPALPAFKESGYKSFVEGTVGEFDHRILLEQYIGETTEPEELVPHWRGGKFQIQENKRDNRFVLQYVSEWDSEDAAKRIFEAYKKVLKGKWKLMKVNRDEPAILTGEGDDGAFILQLDRTRVTSLEGLPSTKASSTDKVN